MTINSTAPNITSRKYAKLYATMSLNEALEANKGKSSVPWIKDYYRVGDILVKLGHMPSRQEVLYASNIGKMSSICVMKFYKSLNEIGAIPKPQPVII